MKSHKQLIGILLILLTLAHSSMSAAAFLWVPQPSNPFTLQLCTGSGVITAPLSLNEVNQVFKGQINQDLLDELTLTKLDEDSGSHHFTNKHCPLCFFNQQNLQTPATQVFQKKPFTQVHLTVLSPFINESIYVDSPHKKLPPKRGPPHLVSAA